MKCFYCEKDAIMLLNRSALCSDHAELQQAQYFKDELIRHSIAMSEIVENYNRAKELGMTQSQDER